MLFSPARRRYTFSGILLALAAVSAIGLCGGAVAQSASTNSSKARVSKTGALDPGAVKDGVYRNVSFGFTCKIPQTWVLRTDEMNATEEDAADQAKSSNPKSSSGKVLLAAFSRPPEAHGEEINSSIVIAAEPVDTYPGLKDAAQYFGPIAEIAKAQGFEVDEEPYEFAAGTKSLVRGDFEKDVGTRVMHQSTLVMLARGYAVSFTFIGGTEDEVEELVQGLSFGMAGNAHK